MFATILILTKDAKRQNSGRAGKRASVMPVKPPSRAAPADFAVDESQPTTRVQIRLADGSRLVARFNQSHTVADVRNFISLQPADGPSSDSLVTGPPMPTALEEDSVTLKEAGLLGAVILQK